MSLHNNLWMIFLTTLLPGVALLTPETAWAVPVPESRTVPVPQIPNIVRYAPYRNGFSLETHPPVAGKTLSERNPMPSVHHAAP